MKIAIAGYSGFIGSRLVLFLQEKGFEVIKLPRNEVLSETQFFKDSIANSEVVINLSGANVLRRWTKKNKEEIFNSRVLFTRNIVNELNRSDNEKLFICASAIGLYRNNADHDETSTDYGDGFLSDVVQKWEDEAGKAKPIVRVCNIRLGIVLGKDGGSFPKLIQSFRYRVAGIIGNGNQLLSFIHIDDVLGGILHIITNNAMSGPANFVAPHKISFNEFAQVASREMHCFMKIHIPAFFIKIIFGSASEILINGCYAAPAKLLKTGYPFTYPDIKKTIKNLV